MSTDSADDSSVGRGFSASPAGPARVDVAALIERLAGSGATVATAESLTGGLVVATLVDVPGASRVVRGGVVAYAADVKASMLGVPAALLDERGTVDPDVASAMAQGARDRLRATYGLATTGVAGPEPHDGAPVGRVHVAVAGPDGVTARSLDLAGDRAAVRHGAVVAALALLADAAPS